MKEYLQDNGYKSRKFLLILFTIFLVSGLGVLWSSLLWNPSILTMLIDSTMTLALGYCGISTARAAIPVASTSIAKTITANKTAPQSAINAKENLAGDKNVI